MRHRTRLFLGQDARTQTNELHTAHAETQMDVTYQDSKYSRGQIQILDVPGITRNFSSGSFRPASWFHSPSASASSS
ncbi:hypothetical protein SBA5_880038 [Candidatus Sulfotelmatomonas gaucii]|uniref:Uncharacterized protein n=1 Tax=Candidatus Sulfuritelmatomonas gaucii TaxID=2043161 RepID=A0A2N9M7F0_9BACT|nr:hypothetical protein SBA5_880038 [Candidatus Sulfotelmatomonas gaucii]